jgi:hypothetical protein
VENTKIVNIANNPTLAAQADAQAIFNCAQRPAGAETLEVGN